MATKPKRKVPVKGRRKCTKKSSLKSTGRPAGPRSGRIARSKSSLQKINNEKWSEEFPAKVNYLICECGLINRRGEIDYPRVARVLKVGVRILQRWRNPLDELYKPALAEAVRAAQENIDAGHIHRGLIDLAKPHTVLKRIRVLRESGPQPPPRSWRKKELLTFGRIRLGIELDPKTNVNELRIIIDHECEKRREQKLVTAREERTTELDVQAAKFVLTNIGDPEKRWMVKEGRVHDTTGTLARLIAEINDCPEPILEPAKLNDGAAVQGESEEQVLEIEQPLLDNG